VARPEIAEHARGDKDAKARIAERQLEDRRGRQLAGGAAT